MAGKKKKAQSKAKGTDRGITKQAPVSKAIEKTIGRAVLAPLLPKPPKTIGKGPPVTSPRPLPAAKTLGRAAESAGPAERAGKTLGRAKGSDAASATSVLSRALVRQKIADRLAGKLTPAGLATWARQQWLDVQRGAPAESGQRETLEDSLQQLTLSALPASKLSEDQLVELMTQLD